MSKRRQCKDAMLISSS